LLFEFIRKIDFSSAPNVSQKIVAVQSFSYKKALSRYGVIPSYSSVNHSRDENVAQESWHASLKKEWLSIRKIYIYKDGVDIIGSYIKFYNTERIHPS